MKSSKMLTKTLVAILLVNSSSMPGAQADGQVFDQELQGQANLTNINNQDNIQKMKFLGEREAIKVIPEVDSSTLSTFIDYSGLHVLARQHLDYQMQKINNFASGKDAQEVLACSTWQGANWYNLQPLQKHGDEYWQVQGHTSQSDQEEIIFNICETFDPTKDAKWATCQKDRVGYLGTTQMTECHSLSKADPGQTYSELKDSDDKVIGVTLEYTRSEEKCADGNNNYGLKINIKCNGELKSSEAEKKSFVNEEDCQQIIEMESGAGCPAFDVNQLFAQLQKYYILWGLLLLCIGLLCAFFGRKMIKPVIFIITFITIGFASLLLFYTLFLKNNETDWVFWVMFFVCAILGIIGGVLSVKFPRVGLAMLFGLAGFFISILLMQTFQLRNQIAFWIVAAASFVLSFGLIFITSVYVIIISTSILGGYFTMRGISAFAGGFPNEFVIVQELQTGAITSLPWYFYLYLVGMIVVTVTGSFIQIRKYKSEDPHPYHHPGANPFKNL